VVPEPELINISLRGDQRSIEAVIKETEVLLVKLDISPNG